MIGCVGDFGVADGGIERIDAENLDDLGYAITETALGGDVLDIAWNGAARSYAIVGDASYNNLVMSWSATSGAAIDTVYAPGGFTLPDCEVNSLGELYVCYNGSSAPGVRIYHAGPDTLLAGPLDTGLPPQKVAFR